MELKKILIPIFLIISLLSFLIFLNKSKLNFFKAQINLREGFEQKELEIEDFEEKLGKTKEEISELKEEITKLKSEGLEELKSSLSDIEKRLEKLMKKEKSEKSETDKEVTLTENWCEKIPEKNPKRNKIIFNEICWMGSQNSPNDEWIELKNISKEEIDLTDWQILTEDKKIKINLSGKILAEDFFLLERIDDDSLPEIKADLIYSGALENENEALFLFDKNCQLQDEIIATPNWPAGDNLEKRTMERKSDFSWQTSSDSGGTPKSENSKGYVKEEEILPEIIPQIEITEIMYNPEGSDEGREWIEIFNRGENSIDFSSLIFYENNTSHKLNLVWGTEKFSSKGYAIISNDSDKFQNDFPNFSKTLLKSSFSLSNDGETFALKYKDTILDEVSYNQFFGGNGTGNSIQKVGAVWKEEIPSPGEENKAPQTQAPTPQPESYCSKILISEVQIWDFISSDNDFIELYNPCSNNIDISGFQLKKKTSTGNESSIRVFPTESIFPAKGYFLWANSKDGYGESLVANVSSTATLAQNNSIALFDQNGNIIDKVAWGSSTNSFVEGPSFPQNPEKGQSLSRRWSSAIENYIDTDNNQEDFVIQNPTPKAKNE